MTPNTSIATNGDRTDTPADENGTPKQMFGRMRERNGQGPAKLNGYRANKISSMTNIPERRGLALNGGEGGSDEVDSAIIEKNFCTPEQSHFNGMHRMKSLGSLSQYELSFGTTPKSLAKLKEELEVRQHALAKRRSLTNLFESNLLQAEMEERDALKQESIFGDRPIHLHAKYKKRLGVGDTKYIGGDDSHTPDKCHQLTKMKSLGTIPDLLSEPITYDPFLTPMVGRRHPASLHNVDGERQHSPRPCDDSNGSSDMDDESAFLRNQHSDHVRFLNDTGLMKGSFERGFRRSYNRKHGQVQPTTPLRQSDGYFQMPLPVTKKPYRNGNEERNRSSVHSLPSDGKFEVIIRYDLVFQSHWRSSLATQTRVQCETCI